jgi:hypothetical protein
MDLIVSPQTENLLGDPHILTMEFVTWKAYGMQMWPFVVRNYFRLFMDSPKKITKLLLLLL